MNAQQLALAVLAATMLVASSALAVNCPASPFAQDGAQVCLQSSDPYIDPDPVVVIDFWGNWSSDPNSESTTIQNVIGLGMPASRWMSVTDQYPGYGPGGVYGYIDMDHLQYGGWINDTTNPVPAAATLAQVQAEAVWAMGHISGWGSNTIILIAFPPSQPNFPIVVNSQTGCAYHGSQTSNSSPWPYFIALPYIPANPTVVCGGCQTSLHDCILTTSMQHELQESVTDLATESTNELAYYDQYGAEVADKCSESSTGLGWAAYPQQVGMMDPSLHTAFTDTWVQPVWSDEASALEGDCIFEFRTHAFGFYKNTSNQIEELVSATSLEIWPNISGVPAASPITAVAAGSISNNGAVQAWYIDTNGNYIQNWSTGGTNWGAPAGYTWNTSVKPDIVSWGVGQVDFFGVAANSVGTASLFHRGWNANLDTGWQNWGVLSGFAIGNAGVGVATWGQGRLDAFLSGFDITTFQTHLIHAYCSSASNCSAGIIGWDDWGVLPNGIQGDPGATGYTSGWATSSTNSNPINRLDILLTDASGKLGHIWWQTNYPYVNYDSSFTTPNGAAIEPSPAVAPMGDERFLIGVVNANHVAWTSLYDAKFYPDGWSESIATNDAKYFAIASY